MLTRRHILACSLLVLVIACDEQQPDSASNQPPPIPVDCQITNSAESFVEQFVCAHNEVRANALPQPDPPLPELGWSETAAQTAQTWANNCNFEHNTNRGNFGENIAAFSYSVTPQEVVEAWASEVEFYDLETNSCIEGELCGHYTQIVWRETISVGCAVAQCDTIDNLNFGGYLWVCNYYPHGNIIGRGPY